MWGFNKPVVKTLDTITASFTQAIRDLGELQNAKTEEAEQQAEEIRELELQRAENLIEANKAGAIRARLQSLVG